MKRAASRTARFSYKKCNNYKGHWSLGSGLFNLSYLFSIINGLITACAHTQLWQFSLKVRICDPNVNKRVHNSKQPAITQVF